MAYGARGLRTCWGFGLSKTKMLIAMGQIRSMKDGHHRRVPPEWLIGTCSCCALGKDKRRKPAKQRCYAAGKSCGMWRNRLVF